MTQQSDTLEATETTETSAAPQATPTAAPPQETPPADGDKPAHPEAGGDILDNTAETEDKSQSTGDVLSGDDDAGDEGVPDSYTFDLPDEMAQDGLQIEEEKLEAFKAQAKEMGLSQKQFQGIVEYDLQRTQEAITYWQDRVDGWRESARTDKDFGGENYAANVKAVLGVVEQFGDADFKAMIKSPSPENPDGLAIGNHPAFLRTMNRIAKKLGDPSLVLGDDVQKTDLTEAKLRRMYPSMYKDSA